MANNATNVNKTSTVYFR